MKCQLISLYSFLEKLFQSCILYFVTTYSLEKRFYGVLTITVTQSSNKML
jgi:hypothetical protein